MRSSLHKLAAWLVLVAYLASGIASGPGLVVCLEADGSAALELASSGCDGCPGTGDDGQGAGRGSNELSSCPCLDVPVPLGAGVLRAQLKSFERADPEVCAAIPACRAKVSIVSDPLAPRFESSRAHPRPARGLAHLRTVVLRV